MDASTHASTHVVHYFDTTVHAVPCGSPGFSQASTKHARSVTCQACVAYLRARSAPAQAQASDLAGAAHA